MFFFSRDGELKWVSSF